MLFGITFVIVMKGHIDMKTEPIALISVSDKTGVVEFARSLQDLGFEIVSTGGTAAHLLESGVKVLEVQDLTGTEEMLEGRVKTLHPVVHGGILYKRSDQGHREQVRKHKIRSIDLVAVNLYPFEATAKANPDDLDIVLEQIDVGGPTLLRAAAKNHRDVLAVVDPGDYEEIISELRGGKVMLSMRRRLAVKVFQHTGRYDRAIETFLGSSFEGKRSEQICLEDVQDLEKYAENWHQKGALAHIEEEPGPSLLRAEQVHGDVLGYNNYLDGDSALGALLEFQSVEEPCVVVLKHGNPCGLALAQSSERAIQRAWQGDPTSAFGGVLAFNTEVTREVFEVLTNRESGSGSKGWFVELILAPSFTPEALEWLRGKKSKRKLRLMELGSLRIPQGDRRELRSIRGGLLIQQADHSNILSLDSNSILGRAQYILDPHTNTQRMVGVVSAREPNPEMGPVFDFANRSTKHLKSNAIGIGRLLPCGGLQLIGAGMGQPNRKDSAQIAISRAVENLREEFRVIKGQGTPYHNAILKSEINFLREQFPGIQQMEEEDYIRDQLALHCVAASDAFFPFADGLEQLARCGIRHVIQPGGSMRDDEVIEAANRLEMVMIFSGMRHFKH